MRLIFSTAVIGLLVPSIATLALSFAYEINLQTSPPHEVSGVWAWLHVVLSAAYKAISDSSTFIRVAVAAGCVVLAKSYQISRARLGMIDLLSSEIETICRSVVLTDTVQYYIDKYKAGPKSSKEINLAVNLGTQNPVFTTFMKDLAQLDAAQSYQVAAFYAFLGRAADAVKNLEAIEISSDVVDEERWRRMLLNVIYFLFLALEKARMAVDMVEFEPIQLEQKATILLAELVAFEFLASQFKGDFRHRRLEARGDIYRRIVPRLYMFAMSAKHPAFCTSKDVASELISRFRKVFPDPESRSEL